MAPKATEWLRARRRLIQGGCRASKPRLCYGASELGKNMRRSNWSFIGLSVALFACSGAGNGKKSTSDADSGGSSGSASTVQTGGKTAACEAGNDGCPCYPNKTCNDDLTCVSQLCLTEGTGGSSGHRSYRSSSERGGTGAGGEAPAAGGVSSTGGTEASTEPQSGVGGSIALTSTGGTASSTGGTASSTGGTASSTGGTASSTGGTASSTGGTASSTGGTTSSTGGTASSTGGTSSTRQLLSELQSGTHAIFYLSGTAQFSNVSYAVGSTPYSTQTAINFEIGRVSPIRFYLTDNGVKVLHPEYFVPVTTQLGTNGSVGLSYAWNAARTTETFSATVNGSTISVQHLFVRSLDDGTTTGTTVRSQSTFTASLSMVSEAAWVPPPPYGWQIAPLSGTASGVKLSWKEDVSSDTLKQYNVYRDQQLIATVTEPTYSDSTGLSCDTLGFCSAVYKVVAVSNTGASSAGAQLTCTWGTYISLTCTADYAG